MGTTSGKLIGYVVIDSGHVSGRPRVVAGLVESSLVIAHANAVSYNTYVYRGDGEVNRYTVAEVREIDGRGTI